jgi:predicted enzyme related to lactoylglutathione lyase
MPQVTIARLIVSVNELEPALAFYTDVVGLSLQNRHGDIAMLSTSDGIQVMLHERPTVVPENATVSIGFLVDDLDAVVRTWESHGGVILDPPAEQAWGERMSVVRDPDGHVVCLSEAAIDQS